MFAMCSLDRTARWLPSSATRNGSIVPLNLWMDHMQGIASWLEGHGLAEYSELFAREAIDLDTLPKLTEEDLRGLGLPLGHRLKLRDAIATLVGYTQPALNVHASRADPAPEPGIRLLCSTTIPSI